MRCWRSTRHTPPSRTARPTAELAPLAVAGGELFGLHASGHGRYVLFAGGLPVLIDGVAVGGVGVSGGSAEQDVACAEAALAALLAQI